MAFFFPAKSGILEQTQKEKKILKSPKVSCDTKTEEIVIREKCKSTSYDKPKHH